VGSEKFGVYIHIPFCIQRCSYCDFATYSQDQITPNQEYVETLLLEISKRRHLFHHKQLDTIYFGGGTPSLLQPKQIQQIINALYQEGFQPSDSIEITIEVNPATLDNQKCRDLKMSGINRVSIGCQTFNNTFLQACGREHNAEDTYRTIDIVKDHFDNFSLDLLFALPGQSLSQLNQDLLEIKKIDPPHVSAYCLTVPQSHPMSRGRAPDEEQTEMFRLVSRSLLESGLQAYEISNFSRPGMESRHNLLYWQDHSYWGIGLSAHSYLRAPKWGSRFWNPSGYSGYIKSINALQPQLTLNKSFPGPQREDLKIWESLTDFCHTHLRLHQGLSEASLHHKFGEDIDHLVQPRLDKLQSQGLITKTGARWKLSEAGILLSNKVFAELLFSPEDIDKIAHGTILSTH
jgi:oxygen-independent coproporphyrinogen III oxidase